MSGASQIRARARESLKNNYWLSVAVVFIAQIIAGAAGGIILLGTLNLGLAIFFLGLTRRYKVSFETLFKGFNDFANSLVLGLLYSIFIFLWSLLFIIPGIIKMYSYSMSFYILADNPRMDAQVALKQSMEMMQGHKWELFCLNFSFIGWIFLCFLTCGIGAIFLAPYMQASTAEFYEELKATTTNR